MQRRTSLLLPALPAIALGLASAASSSAAADDCLAGPNAPAAPGTHWYYRVDRATHRQCWYLGAEGAHVRSQTRQASAPAKPQPAKASAPAAPPPAAQVASPEPARDKVIPVAVAAEAAAIPAQPADDAAEAPTRTRWADAGNPGIATDAAPSAAAVNATQEPAASDTEDEMPLIWPVLTPEELAGADQPSGSAFAHLAGLFAAVMGIAALIGMLLLRISTGRRPRRSAAAQGAGRELAASRPRTSMYDRVAENASSPAARTEPWAGAPDYEVEETVPDLLRELHRRARRYELNEAMLAPAR